MTPELRKSLCCHCGRPLFFLTPSPISVPHTCAWYYVSIWPELIRSLQTFLLFSSHFIFPDRTLFLSYLLYVCFSKWHPIPRRSCQHSAHIPWVIICSTLEDWLLGTSVELCLRTFSFHKGALSSRAGNSLGELSSSFYGGA